MTTAPSQHDVDRYAAILGEAQKIKGVSLWQDAWRRLRRNWAAMIALAFLIVLALAALFTPLLPLQSPIATGLPDKPGAPDRQFKPPTLQPFSLDFEPVEEQEEAALADEAAQEAAEEFEQGELAIPPADATPAEESAADPATATDDTENDPGAPAEATDETTPADDSAEEIPTDSTLDDSAPTEDSAEDTADDYEAFNDATLPLTERLAAWDARMAELHTQLAAATTDEERQRVNGLIAQVQPADPVGKLWNNPGPLDRLMIRGRLAMFGSWCIPSLCGTDSLGRDVLARLFWGARVSLMVGLVASLVSLVIGVTYGATAGYLGGWVDNAMMRFVDVLYSIPFIFVVIFLLTFLTSKDVKDSLEAWHINQIVIFYFVIGAIYWLTMSRVVRGQVISLKNEQFVEAARTIGASQQRIILRHLIPNVMSIVIVYLTLTIPAVMLFEAFLSFLGLGVKPPDVSWGMLASEGITVITPVKIYWWLFVFPGLTLALTLLSLMFLGDGLRDALDPKMKNR